jgi:phenylacetate-CoA ligase
MKFLNVKSTNYYSNFYEKQKQFEYFFRLRKSQWKPNRLLKKNQEKKLRKLIDYSYHHVRYYHRLFKTLNIKPYDIKKVDDLNKIPILTKGQIKKNFQDFLPNLFNFKNSFCLQTSGSTGLPLKIYIDKNTHNRIGARQLRSYFACGYKITDILYNFSAPHHFISSKEWYNFFHLFRKKNFSVFDSINHHILQLKKSPPDIIKSYPSVLYLLANQIENLDIKEINPRLIFTSSELLTKKLREKINYVFNSEIFDQYGSVEFGTFAWECLEHTGYHIDIEDIILEFLKDKESITPGEEGEIVVTDLNNLCMPLIRYSLGDISAPVAEKCSCGRELPLMRLIDGRKDDFILLPNGIRISPRNIGSLEYIEGIDQFQIIQNKIDEIEIQIIKNIAFSLKTIEKIKQEIKKGTLGQKMNIRIKLVNQISRTRSGKSQMIISKVNNYKTV